MNDDKNAVVESAVEETTQTSSPQVKEATTEPQTPKEQATPEAVPEESEETRREFQAKRLNEENRRLKEELKAREQRESAFAAFRQPVVPDLNQGLRVEDYTDPVTGEVNRPAYNAAYQATQARQAAFQAQQSVAEQIDEYQARQKFPHLFSDAEIEQEIADRWFAAKMRGENVTVSFVAERVNDRFAKAVSKAEKQGVEKALTEVGPKEQAGLAASAQTSQPARTAQAGTDLDNLRELSRQGSDDAIAARLAGIPWANK